MKIQSIQDLSEEVKNSVPPVEIKIWLKALRGRSEKGVRELDNLEMCFMRGTIDEEDFDKLTDYWHQDREKCLDEIDKLNLPVILPSPWDLYSWLFSISLG